MENTLRELLQERDGYLQEARAIKDLAKKEERLRTDEEQEKVDGLLVKIRTLNKTVEQDKEMQEYQERFSQHLGEPVKPDPNDNPWGVAIGQFAGDTNAPGSTSLRGPTYRAMFGKDLSTDGFNSFQEFVTAVGSQRSHPNLRSMVEGIPSDGGFLVPDEFAAQIFDVALESEIVRPRATLYPMNSKVKKIPATTIGDHSSNLFGGVTASWKAEEGTMTGAEPKFRQMELTANKLTCFGITSNELVDDGLNVEESISKTFTGALSFYLDRDFLKGDGAGKPLGVLNAACLITVAKEGGQAADTIEYANLTKMLSRLHPASLRNAVWICHTSTIPQLLGLSIPVGTGGSFYPAMSESNGNFRMLSRPVIFSEKSEALGDVGDIMLCDFSQYAVGLRKEMRLESSIHAKFSTDQTSWRMIIRVDGQPLWNEVLTLEDGVNTVSPFITLAARA